MMNKSNILRIACVSAIVTAFVLVSGQFSPVNAQRDPFAKASYMKQKPPAPAGVAGAKVGKSGPMVAPTYGAPMIEARIEYYKRLREVAAANGQPLPKVTSVLTLNELAVTGIFKTPRGYAAMVEATPIKLSYTIYPGEKFFDGQLVAVEENKLVFRKVTKTGPGKFVASVENKPLQQFTMRAQIEGTAPTQSADKTVHIASTNAPPVGTPAGPMTVVSPLDEMNSTPVAEDKSKTKKGSKRPVKIAKN